MKNYNIIQYRYNSVRVFSKLASPDESKCENCVYQKTIDCVFVKCRQRVFSADHFVSNLFWIDTKNRTI